MQIHIDLYDPRHFFICGTDIKGHKHIESDDPAINIASGWPVGQKLRILQPEMHLETFTLTDSIVRKLSQISASGGLEWYFDAVHQMDGQARDASEYTMQITRALSRANNIIVKTRSTKNLYNAYEDSISSQTWYKTSHEGGGLETRAANQNETGVMNNFQVQLGAQYIPSRSLKDRKEFVHSALKTFSQFRRADGVGGVDDVMYSGFPTSRLLIADPNGAEADAPLAGELRNVFSRPDTGHRGLAISAVPLESSSTLQQSGAAISAQRTAVVNMGWDTDGSNQVDHRRVDAFVVYSKLVTLYLDSVVVRS